MRILKPVQDVTTSGIKERKIADLPLGMVFVGKIFDAGNSLSVSDGVFLVVTNGQDKYLANLKTMEVFRATVAIIDEAATEATQIEIGAVEAPVVVPEPEVAVPVTSGSKRWGL